MSDRESAYDHQSETAGPDGGSYADQNEHRDTARGDDAGPNEISPDERGRGDGYGPRTHEDTRTSRKGESEG